MSRILAVVLMCASSVVFAHGSSHPQNRWRYHVDDLGTPYMQCGNILYAEHSTLYITVGEYQLQRIPVVVGPRTMEFAIARQGYTCYGHGFTNEDQ